MYHILKACNFYGLQEFWTYELLHDAIESATELAHDIDGYHITTLSEFINRMENLIAAHENMNTYFFVVCESELVELKARFKTHTPDFACKNYPLKIEAI